MQVTAWSSFPTVQKITNQEREDWFEKSQELEAPSRGTPSRKLNVDKLKKDYVNCSKIIFCMRSDNTDGVMEVNNFIGQLKPTPKEFDDFCQTKPDYKLEQGNCWGVNALCVAAAQGDEELIKHIVKIGGMHLVNLGSENGTTPLMYAANCKNPQLGFKAARTLMDLGASINMAKSRLDDWGPKEATALLCAIKMKNIPLIQLLICEGGVVRKELSNKKQNTVDEAMKKLFVNFVALRNDLTKDVIGLITRDMIDLS